MKKLLTFFICIISICCLSANVIFVNSNGSSISPTGESWETAFTDLQDALTIAIAGDSIWVATGTYFPTSTNDRDISFSVPNGVKLFGGFVGNELLLTNRDHELNPTILNGDIGTFGDSTDNSYHVLLMSEVDSTTLIDGFKITEGNAVDSIFSINDRNYGGGILINSSSDLSISNPQIWNCKFYDNVGRFGAAVGCNGGNNTLMYPTILNCHFQNNKAKIEGGAIYLTGQGILTDTIEFVKDCFFEKNTALFGGAISLNNSSGIYLISNSNFIENTVNGTGGAFNFEINSNANELIVSECDFLDNESADGGAIYVNINGSVDFARIKIIASDFIRNDANSGSALLLNGFGSAPIKVELHDNVFKDNIGSSSSQIITIGYSFGVGMEFYVDRCTFSGIDDSTLNKGGAIWFSGSFSDSIRLNVSNSIFHNIPRGVLTFRASDSNVRMRTLINNCTFINNGEYIIRNNLHPDFDSLNIINSVEVVNSIFWEDMTLNEIFSNGLNDDTTMYQYDIHHSLIKPNDCILNGINWCGAGMLFGIDPLFKDTLNDDFRLKDCSPLINVGNNAVVDTNLILLDLEGNQRIQNDTVDLGAYEQRKFELNTVTITNASGSDIDDGSIVINEILGATLPLTYNWSNGSTFSFLEKVLAGEYSVTITDADGCEFDYSFQVDFETANESLERDVPEILISPNPLTSNEQLQISLNSDEYGISQIEIFNANGQKILEESVSDIKAFEVSELGSLTKGIYFVRIRLSSENVMIKKFVVH